MARLIDADKVLEAIRERKKEKMPNYWNEDFSGMYIEGLNTAEHEVKYAATVEAEPVRHGKWINAYDTSGGSFYKCSECACYIDKTFFANDYAVDYCPNCGAKMDGDGT